MLSFHHKSATVINLLQHKRLLRVLKVPLIAKMQESEKTSDNPDDIKHRQQFSPERRFIISLSNRTCGVLSTVI